MTREHSLFITLGCRNCRGESHFLTENLGGSIFKKLRPKIKGGYLLQNTSNYRHYVPIFFHTLPYFKVISTYNIIIEVYGMDTPILMLIFLHPFGSGALDKLWYHSKLCLARKRCGVEWFWLPPPGFSISWNPMCPWVFHGFRDTTNPRERSQQWPSKSAERPPSVPSDHRACRAATEQNFFYKALGEQKKILLGGRSACSVVARWALGSRSVAARQTCSATARRALSEISGGCEKAWQMHFHNSAYGKPESAFTIPLFDDIPQAHHRYVQNG